MTNFNEVLSYIPGDKKEEAQNLIKNLPSREHTPFIVNALSFIGAWAGLLFFLFFLGLVFFSIFGAAGAFIMGAAFMAAAFWLQRGAPDNVFLRQLMVAMMFLGKASLICGVFYMFKRGMTLDFYLLTVFIVVAAVYPFFKSGVDRFAGVFAVASAAYLFEITGLYSGDNLLIWKITTPQIIVALSFAFSLWVFFYRRAALYPIAYALMAAALFVPHMAGEGQNYVMALFTFPKLIVIAGAAAFAFLHLKLTDNINKRSLLILAVCALGLFLFNIASAIGIAYIILGRNFKDKKVEIMGYIVFAGGLGYLYYSLHTTLLVKSGILCLSGLAALAAAFCAGRLCNEK